MKKKEIKGEVKVIRYLRSIGNKEFKYEMNSDNEK
jgi:hypothetical protein